MSISVKQLATASRVEKSEKDWTDSIAALLKKDLVLSKKLSDKKKERFYAELGILLSAGIDIKTTLEIATEEQNKKKEGDIFRQIKDNVIGGGTFSDALYATGNFSDYEYYSLKIGEESGKLPEILQNLSEYYAKKIAQRRKLISTFSYPVIVLTMAIGAIYFMLNFIVPMFEEVFKRFDGDLPALTKTIISISEWCSTYAGIIVMVIAGAVIVLFTQRKQRWYRQLTSSVVLKLPFFGQLINKIYLARFAHSLQFLLGAKNPLLTSLQLVRKMIGFYPYEQALLEIEKDILHGISLSQSLAKHSFFHRKMIYLIKVAEEVNQLEVIFEQLNHQLNDEVEHKMNTLGSLMEPFLILFIGFFVAIILIAMYLPLFQLSTSVF